MMQLQGTPGGDLWSQLGDFFGKSAERNIKRHQTRKGLESMGVDPARAEGMSRLPEGVLNKYMSSMGSSGNKGQGIRQELSGSDLADKMFSRRVKGLQGAKDPDDQTLEATEQSRSNVISKIKSGADPETAISGGVKNVNKIKVGNQIIAGKKFNPSKAWTAKGKQEDISKASKNLKPLIRQGVYSQEDAIQKLVESGWSKEDATLATTTELSKDVAKYFLSKSGNSPQKAKKLAESYGFKV